MDNKKKLIIGGAVLGLLAIIAIVVNLSSSDGGDPEGAKMAEQAASQPAPEQPAPQDPGPPVSAGGTRRASP